MAAPAPPQPVTGGMSGGMDVETGDSPADASGAAVAVVDEEDKKEVSVYDMPLPDENIPEEDGGLTDSVKADIVNPARQENKRIASMNENLAHEVKRIRYALGQVKQKVMRSELQEKAELEREVRVMAAQREAQERALKAQRKAEETPEQAQQKIRELTALMSLSHLCFLRGWKSPSDEYNCKSGGPTACAAIAKQLGRSGLTSVFTCVLKLDKKGDVVEIEGDWGSSKKDAKEKATKKLLLSCFPECDTFEEVQAKIQAEKEAKKKAGGFSFGKGKGGGKSFVPWGW